MAEAMMSKRKRVEEESIPQMCPRLQHNVEEQIRRDGLKDGFAQLDAVLPQPPTKKSRCQRKVLDTAAQYIQDLEQVPNKYEEQKRKNEEMEERIRELEDRLREQSAASTPDTAMANSREENTPDPYIDVSMASASETETADFYRGLLDVYWGVQEPPMIHPHSPDPDSSPMDFCSRTLWDGNDLDSIYESYLGKIE